MIELNPNLTDEHQLRTLGHELAHALDYWLDGGNGHGPTWAAWMRRLGLAVERCHDYPELLDSRKKYRAECRDCSWVAERATNVHVCPACGSPDLKVELRTE